MIEYTKAFIVGGWSEIPSDLAAFAHEITEGDYSFVSEAEVYTLSEALAGIRHFQAEARRRTVITHSAGALAVADAGSLITLNGPEPTSLKKLFTTAPIVAWHGLSRHEFTARSGVKGWASELGQRPVIQLISRISKFSTIEMLRGRESGDCGGCAYIVSARDEFGYGLHGEVELARTSGIPAAVLPGGHNQALVTPEIYAKQIAKFMSRVPEAA